jgi:hypothetical protein
MFCGLATEPIQQKTGKVNPATGPQASISLACGLIDPGRLAAEILLTFRAARR